MAKLSKDVEPQSKNQATIQKRVKPAEAVARVFSKIQCMRNSSQLSGFSHLEVPIDPSAEPKAKTTQWQTIDGPIEIEEILLRRNQKHFGQTKGTPFTVPPLSKMVNFTASSHIADLILDGEYHDDKFSATTQLMIDHCQYHVFEEDQQHTKLITDKDFIGKMKSWKESTSTSPSGFHLGHWNALCARHIHLGQDTEAVIILDTQQTAIRHVVILLINYVLKWGCSYEQWKTVVNMMIFKDPDVYKIHHLCVIHLYEADYNFILATKWRHLIHQVCDHDLIHPGQNGAVLNMTAQNPVFIEKMQHEVSRTSHKHVVKFDNDTTACYDRIITAIAAIICRKYGMKKNVNLVISQHTQRVSVQAQNNAWCFRE